MEDSDLKLARQLQEQFDSEPSTFPGTDRYAVTNSCTTNERSGKAKGEKNLSLSVIDPIWEITDPNPDVHLLFMQFNIEYFWGKLAGVEVKWSPRMTLCAGVCSYEGRGGLCSIRLSVPLLKLRPRKDLVETLLHEMIHAYLFVTDNDRDRDGHGPNFTKHMNRINEASGAKITIYHDFHDEVESYRQHWWRCEGPCKNRPPFYGWVKRSMNRAPSAKDYWWEDHRRSCGGTYTKVKEPEGYGQKKKVEKDDKENKSKEKDMATGTDIRSFFGKGHVLGGTGESKNNLVLDSDKKSNTKTTGSSSSELKVKGSQTDLISKLNTKIIGGFNSGRSIDNKSTSGTAGKVGNKNDVPLNQMLAVPPGWEGGIWSGNDEFFASTSKPDVTLKEGQSSSPLLGPRKTWTAVAPDAARKDNTCTSDSAGSSGSLQGGYVLGSQEQGSLSWLARIRKEWMSKDDNKTQTDLVKNATRSARSNELCEPFQGNKDDDVKSVQNCAQDKNNAFHTHNSKAEKYSNEMLESKDIENMLSPWSDEDSSLHGSFHVSSCEIDEWPSPDIYPDYLAPSCSSVCQKKRKSTSLDLSSCDEEKKNRFKYLKLQQSSSGSDCSQDLSAKLNDFQKFKSSSPVRDTKILPNVGLSSVMVKQSNSQWHGEQFPTAANYSNSSLTSTSSNNYSDYAENNSTSLNNLNACEVVTDQNILDRPELNVVSNPLIECPSCGQRVPSAVINDHLDTCLS